MSRIKKIDLFLISLKERLSKIDKEEKINANSGKYHAASNCKTEKRLLRHWINVGENINSKR